MDDWPMTIIVDHHDGKPFTLDAPPYMSDAVAFRRAFAAAVGQAARMTKPTKIAFISSSWQVEYGKDDPTPKLPPSRHPNRKEAVIVVVADAEIEAAFTAPIQRRKYGPPLLGEWRETNEVSGPMMDPWRDALR
jgi:hypothetical protein